MDDVPADEITALLAGGPDDFVANRTARSRALRQEGRREEAAALAKVRKPLRLTWVLVDVARAEPALVEAAADAAEALEEAQSAGGGRVRPLLGTLRAAVDDVVAAVARDGSGADRAEVALAARQVVGDESTRRAWVEGRLLALPVPDTEGGRPAVRRARPPADGRDRDGPGPDEGPGGDELGRRRARRRPQATVGATTDAASAEAERARQADAERARRAEARQRIRAAEAEREAAATTLAEAEDALAVLESEVEELRARRDDARDAVRVARGGLATSDAALAAARRDGGGDPTNDR